MKNYIVIAILSVSFFFVGWKSKNFLDLQNEGTRPKLDILFENHDQLVYQAFFDLSELRPFSILQHDKTVEIYDKKFLSSDEYLNNLDINQRKILTQKVIDFIDSKDDQEQKRILTKINSYCITAKQFDLILNEFKVEKDQLVKVMIDNDLTQNQLSDLTTQDEINKIEIISSAKNAVSELSKSEQFKYHSLIFSELSSMAVK